MIFSLIDTETTNLTMHPDVDYRRQPRMVEFAGILTDGQIILDELEYMVNPMRAIDPGASKVSGITDEAVLNFAPMDNDRLLQTSAFLLKADVIIAHNLSFDKRIMTVECERLSCDLSYLSWPRVEVCTVEETQFMFGKPMKLQTLYELAFGEYKQKHRARSDLDLLHAVCQYYGVYEALQRRYA